MEAEFRAPKLDHLQLLVDIALAEAELRCLRDTVDCGNLDELPALIGTNTTTEYMAFHIHGLLSAACRDGKLGEGRRAVSSLKVLLRESPNAWAAYEGSID